MGPQREPYLVSREGSSMNGQDSKGAFGRLEGMKVTPHEKRRGLRECSFLVLSRALCQGARSRDSWMWHGPTCVPRLGLGDVRDVRPLVCGKGQGSGGRIPGTPRQ